MESALWRRMTIMAFKIPSRITKEWVRENCRCVRLKDRSDRLLCRESCPVHETYDPISDATRETIEEVTKQTGWKLDWHMDSMPTKAKERRP
jgi:hypothetical protein